MALNIDYTIVPYEGSGISSLRTLGVSNPQRIVITKSGVLKQIGFLVSSPYSVFHYKIAMYTDLAGRPGTLVYQSNELITEAYWYNMWDPQFAAGVNVDTYVYLTPGVYWIDRKDDHTFGSMYITTSMRPPDFADVRSTVQLSVPYADAWPSTWYGVTTVYEAAWHMRVVTQVAEVDCIGDIAGKGRISSIALTYPSPPNIYGDVYSIPAPLPSADWFGGFRVDVSWNAIAGADNYLLTRDTQDTFVTTTNAFSGPSIATSDRVPFASTRYFYEIKALNTNAMFESEWSGPTSAYVGGISIDISGEAAGKGLIDSTVVLRFPTYVTGDAAGKGLIDSTVFIRRQINILGDVAGIGFISSDFSDGLQLGATARYIPDGDFVEVEVFAVHNDHVVKGLVTGEAILNYYHAFPSQATTQLRQVQFDPTLIRNDFVCKLLFNHPSYTSNLQISLTANINGTLHSVQLPVNNDVGYESAYSKSGTSFNNNPIPALENFLTNDVRRSTVIEHDLIKPTLVEQNFEDTVSLVKGTDAIQYSGGGNRYLPSLVTGALVYQPYYKSPSDLQAAMFVEVGTRNLLPNAKLNGNTFPEGYAVIGTGVNYFTRLENDQNIIENVKTLSIVCNGSDTWGRSIIFGVSNSIPISVLAPTTFSTFYTAERTDASNLYHLYVRLRFYNVSDVEIGSPLSVEYPVSSFYDNFGMLIVSALPADYPSGTARIRFEIESQGIDPGDRIILKFLCPQLDQTYSVTSRTPDLRLADKLVIAQDSSIDLSKGTFRIVFASGINGYVLDPDGAYFFDTRDPSVLTTGFALRQCDDGRIEFTIDDGTTAQVITSADPFTFVFGTVYDIKASFDEDNELREVTVDDVSILADTTPFISPAVLNDLLFIGQRADNAAYLNSEIREFEIHRTVL